MLFNAILNLFFNYGGGFHVIGLFVLLHVEE
jgi:hypothetical protein